MRALEKWCVTKVAHCNYVVSVQRGFLFLLVLGMGYVILVWHSLSLPYSYFVFVFIVGPEIISMTTSNMFLMLMNRTQSAFAFLICNFNYIPQNSGEKIRTMEPRHMKTCFMHL